MTESTRSEDHSEACEPFECTSCTSPQRADNGATVYLTGLATALPPHELSQTDVAREATAMFAGKYADFNRLRPVFESTGIEKRYSVRPFEWFREEHGWPDRTTTYIEGATALFVESAKAALSDAGLAANKIDTVVTVSSTGIATPSLEAHALEVMGFRDDILRVPVFGLGCAGGVSGLAVAADLARARPGSNVLMVAVEICTLAFRTDKMTKANIVATALFADGAAAVVLSSERQSGTGDGAASSAPAIAIGPAGQVTWPGTLDVMGWNVDPVGFGAIFSKNIPTLVNERMRGAADDFLIRNDMTISDMTDVAFHPGGTRVIEALTDVFELAPSALDTERDVLRNHGNMSAPTVLFVLAQKRAVMKSGRVLMAALGPGFTASFLTLDVQ